MGEAELHMADVHSMPAFGRDGRRIMCSGSSLPTCEFEASLGCKEAPYKKAGVRDKGSIRKEDLPSTSTACSDLMRCKG